MATQDRRIVSAVAEGLFQAPPFRQQLLIAGLSITILLGVLAGFRLLPARVGSQLLVSGQGTPIEARAFVPHGYAGPPLQLEIGGIAPGQLPPAVPGFVALRDFEVTLVQGTDGREAQVAGLVVQLKLTTLPGELSSVTGDATRLRLLHFRSSQGQWEDTRATFADGVLSGTVTDLSPFLLGYFDLAPLPSSPAVTSPAPSVGAPNGSASLSDAPDVVPTLTEPSAAPAPAGPPGRVSQPAVGVASPGIAAAGPPGATADGSNPQISLPAASDEPNPDLPLPSAPIVLPLPSPSLQSVTSGGGSNGSPPTVITITTPGSGSAILSRSAFVPGDTWTYGVRVHNAGGTPFSYSLAVIPTLRSGLDQPESLGLSPDDGLRLSITRCAVGFTGCGSQLYSGALITAGQPIGSLTSGGDDYLQVGLTLASTGSNAFQGLSSQADLIWTAQQTS